MEPSRIALTGDAEATARAMACKLGIDEVHASVSPHDKQEVVQALKVKRW